MSTNSNRDQLGAAHRAQRAQMLPLAYGKQCEMCGHVMLDGMALHLDHVTPRVFGSETPSRMRIVHARCNMAGGGRIGGRLRSRKGKPRKIATTQPWVSRW